MNKEKFRSKVTAETWQVLLDCEGYLDEKVYQGKTVPPVCICCPDTKGNQIFALYEANKDRRWTDRKPTDWKWTHHTLRALEARMQEEIQVLRDEQMARTAILIGKGIVIAVRQTLDEAEALFYKEVIQKAPPRAPLPRNPVLKRNRVAKALTLGEIKAVIEKAGGREDVVSVATALDAMEGTRETSFDSIVDMAVRYGALINDRGWLSLPKKEK